MVGGCYLDYASGWNNPQSEDLWWSGVIIKRNVEEGTYDPQFVSINSLRKEYGIHGRRTKGRTKRSKVAHR